MEGSDGNDGRDRAHLHTMNGVDFADAVALADARVVGAESRSFDRRLARLLDATRLA